jgi:hypothetical protein
MMLTLDAGTSRWRIDAGRIASLFQAWDLRTDRSASHSSTIATSNSAPMADDKQRIISRD